MWLDAPLLVAPAQISGLEIGFPPSDDLERVAIRQRTRGKLRRAEIVINEETLAGWLAGPFHQRARGHGIERVQVRLGQTAVVLVAQVVMGGRRLWITARGRLGVCSDPPGRANGVSLHLQHLRVYGFTPLPGPLCGARVLGALVDGAAGTGATMRVVGLDELRLSPLRLLLQRALPGYGLRLPDMEEVLLQEPRLSEGRVVLCYSTHAAASVQAPPLPKDVGLLEEADRCLLAGAPEEAVSLYRRAVEEKGPHAALAEERLLQTLASLPARFDEAMALAQGLLSGRASMPGPLLALGAIQAELGRTREAARSYIALSEIAENAPEETATAALVAADLLSVVDGKEAQRLLERAAAMPCGLASARAASQLAEWYSREGQWRKLADLEERLLSVAASHSAQDLQRRHLRLAALYLDQLAAPERARDELEKALRIEERSAAAWELMARLAEMKGPPGVEEALEALDRAAALSPPDVAAELLGRAAALAERHGRHEAALTRYQAARGHSPSDIGILTRLAALLGLLERPAEAKEVYESILEWAHGGEEGDSVRRQALVALSRIALSEEAGGGRSVARGYLGRALALGGERDAEVLRAWAALEQAEGHLENVDKALARLEELGENDGLLTRATVLLMLGRPAEAVQQAEKTVARESEQAKAALRVMIQARRAMGDSRGLREALERLLRIDPADEPAHLELGRILIAAGDLLSACDHLRLAGQHPAALTLLAEAEERLGDKEKLLGTLSRLVDALGADPAQRGEIPSVLGRLARLEATLHRREAALEHLRRAMDLLPSSPSAHVVIGEAALTLGRYEDAKRAWEPILGAEPPSRADAEDPLVLVKRHLALAEAGEAEHPKEALDLFRAALDRGARGALATRAWNGIIRLVGHGLAPQGGPPPDGLETEVQALLRAAEDPRTEEPASARAALIVIAAEKILKSGDKGRALDLYEKAAALDPSRLGALDAMEAIAEQIGDHSRLVDVLSRKVRALSSRPAERKQLLARIAEIHLTHLGRRDLARDAYRQALALDPSFRQGLSFFADDAHERGDYGAELVHLKRLAALGDDPAVSSAERAEVHARIAQLHRRAGRFEEAERQALLALELRPDHGQVLSLLDERYTSTERWEDLAAILLIRTEVESDAVERRDALARRAHILDEKLARPDKALHAYHDLVRVAPDQASCVRLATLALELSAFDHIQDVAPIVGRALLDTGQSAAAIPILEHATQRGAGEPLFALLAEAYEAVSDYNRAADAWSAAGRAADPMRFARALERAHRLEEAMAAWVSIASSEPHLADQARKAAVVLATENMQGDTSDATSWARRLLEVDPTNISALVRFIGARPEEELGTWLDALGQRIPDGQAAEIWLTVAEALPETMMEARRLLLQRAAAAGRSPRPLLLLSALFDGEYRLSILRDGLSAFPGSISLALALVEAAEPSEAVSTTERTLPLLSDEQQRVTLLLAASRRCLLAGERDTARTLLSRASSSIEALHERVKLDIDLLESARPGDDHDLAPVLEALRDKGFATQAELSALARLYAARGQHAEAAQVQREAGESPDALLQNLLAEGRYHELLEALTAHARVRPDLARDLYERAAQVAEVHIGDREQAARLLEQAAFCQGSQEDSARLWASAGSLWNALGERDRGAAALGHALTAGGERTPGVLLALGDHAFEASDWDSAVRHYRRALAVGQVPVADHGRIRLRLASIERRRGNAAAEEQELAAAVEAGAGAVAWPALAALFRAQGESARLGAALLAWADYESGAPRLALLRQAATLVSSSLIPRVDDELTKLDADEPDVRDRIQARLREAGDLHALAKALVRDIDKSEGSRRADAARELATLCEQLGDHVAAASAWRVVLEDTTDPPADGQRVLAWLARVRILGIYIPDVTLAPLRGLLTSYGRIGDVITQLDHQIGALGANAEDVPARLDLMREAAELTDSLGDHLAAIGRWSAIVAACPEDLAAWYRARHSMRALASHMSERLDEALDLLERVLRGVAAAGTSAHRVRVLLAEALASLGRTDEAIGQLDLALTHDARFAPAHALLGALMVQSALPDEIAKGVTHLMEAAFAEDIGPEEAGECALLAGEVLSASAVLDDDAVRPEALLQRAAALMPTDRRPLEALCRLAIGRGHYEDALQLIHRQLHLIGDGPDRARILVDLSHVQCCLGQRAAAEATLKEALSIDPHCVPALQALRRLTLDQGRLRDAEELGQQELTLIGEPLDRALLLMEIGHLRRQQGDRSGSLDCYRTAGQLGLAAGWLSAATDLAEQESWLEAAMAAQRAAELSTPEERAPVLFRAAELALRGGDEAQARALLLQASHLDEGAAVEAKRRLHALDGGEDPVVRKGVLESQLPHLTGQRRLDLLRRLLSACVEADDREAVLKYTAEILALYPSDAMAFDERARIFERSGDLGALYDLWEQRAASLEDQRAAADAQCVLARISVQMNDLARAEERYADALSAQPAHEGAMLGLADLAYRKGEYDRARGLYAGFSQIPLDRADAAEILRRCGELADAAADSDAAERAYQQLLNLGLSLLSKPELTAQGREEAVSIVTRGSEELTRVYEQRGDYAGAMAALSHLVPFLPEGAAAESIERRVQVRLHLAWLAIQHGEIMEARRHLQYLLVDRPAHRQGLSMLLDVYRQSEDHQQAAMVLERLVRIAETPSERADLLYERACLFETQLCEPERAFELYQQAVAAAPGHPPSLRRLVLGYLREANGVRVAEVVRELEEAGEPLDDVKWFAGIGLALASNEEHADQLLADAPVPQLAAALAAIELPPPGDLSILDEPIAAAVRALGGTSELARLEEALYQRIQSAPGGLDLGARQILARLGELRSDPSARVHLALLAFLHPDGYASQRLEVLGPFPSVYLTEDPMPEPARGPLRDALSVLGGMVLGLPAPSLPLSPDWGLRLRAISQGAGLARLDVAVVDSLGHGFGDEPASCDPTRPPRLRLLRRLTANNPEVRFAALRAIKLLQWGISLVQGRSAEDVLALIRAAAKLCLPGISLTSRLAQAWLAELQSLSVRPEQLQREQRERLQTALKECVRLMDEEPGALDAALPLFIENAHYAADRQALAETGDLLAALTVLCPHHSQGPRARLDALKQPRIADLISFADGLHQTG